MTEDVVVVARSRGARLDSVLLCPAGARMSLARACDDFISRKKTNQAHMCPPQLLHSAPRVLFDAPSAFFTTRRRALRTVCSKFGAIFKKKKKPSAPVAASTYRQCPGYHAVGSQECEDPNCQVELIRTNQYVYVTLRSAPCTPD